MSGTGRGTRAGEIVCVLIELGALVVGGGELRLEVLLHVLHALHLVHEALQGLALRAALWKEVSSRKTIDRS